jgi:hypothetical protein
MGVMRATGVVIHSRNRFYQVAPQFLVDKPERTLDFGLCFLRMNVGAGT